MFVVISREVLDCISVWFSVMYSDSDLNHRGKVVCTGRHQKVINMAEIVNLSKLGSYY